MGSLAAYFDCYSGASGDMILGALIDAGLSPEELLQGLSALRLSGEYSLKIDEVRRGGLRAKRVQVFAEHSHPLRTLPDVLTILEDSALSPSIRAQSARIFQRLAEVEAYVHGISVEEVHFHEISAVDTLIDVVGVLFGLERLGVAQVYASPLPLGPGQIESEHGALPLPAPATLELLARAGAPTRPSPAGFELVTPTGAAILTTLARFYQPPMRIVRIGYGAGEKELPWPNIMRLWLGYLVEEEIGPLTRLSLLETNIDNMEPEFYGYVMERLFAAGALDVYLTPIYMKKNRPGTMLSVIAYPEAEADLAMILLRETTTLGVRVCKLERYEAEREVRELQTTYGPVQVKVKKLGGRVIGVAPEYESCLRLAKEHAVPLADVYRVALQASAVLLEQESPRSQ
ncbi:MAG: nickel pincer cofactor biosynthesis protein LarC [Anaerolineae bacterium]|nr:nickel pincer cofactor biosynthesis protein LarC [Anaerolineae bacterium]